VTSFSLDPASFQHERGEVMKKLLVLLFVGSLSAFAQTPTAAIAPQYRTAQEIKVFWLNKMPVPRTLDKDYKEMVDARATFIADVRAGKYNDSAEKTAAEYNADLAMKSGDDAKAAFYNTKVEQFAKAIEETAKAAAAKNEVEKNSAAMEALRRQLVQVNRTLSDMKAKQK
jgi:hypothetical protein